MSRKNYIAFAKALYDVKPHSAENDRCNMHILDQWQATVSAIADVFKADNPRFDRERFLRACNGVGK
jgi:hypothetical protein